MNCALCSALLLALGTAWRDDFAGAHLDELWQWQTPVDGPRWSLAERPGWIRFHVPRRDGGFNQWPSANDAPRLMRAVPEGDWEVESRIELADCPRESNFHLALAVMFGEQYFLGWGPFQAVSLWKMDGPEIWLEYPGHGRVAVAPMAGTSATVALRKVGAVYTALVEREGRWAEVGSAEFAFRPVAVGMLLKTFGDGPAVAVDVDYVSCRPLDAQPTRLHATAVVRAGEPEFALSRNLYGHFIEHLGRCVYGGIWAERLANRKFAGRADASGVVEGWSAIGAGGGAVFSPDTRVYVAPAQCQRMVVARGGAERGLVQGAIALEAGRGYSVRVVLRQEGLEAPVLVRLRNGDVVYDERRVQVRSDWTAEQFELRSPADDPDAEFSLTTTGTGTLWFGAVSLMPADNVHGLRSDTLEAIRGLSPPVIRWPGGNFVSGYDWRDGIGPRDARPVRWDRAWGQWEPNDFGTDEFLALCREVGAEPYICANAGEGSAREAAGWVEYCNGSATTAHGALRARNGHREPYGVVVWGLGNEMWGSWQLGALDAEKYSSKAVEMARAMRAASPVALHLVGVGVEGGTWDDWNRRALPLVGHECQYLSVHHYHFVDVADDIPTQLVTSLEAVRGIARMLRETSEIAQAVGSPVPLALDEWNIAQNTTRVPGGKAPGYRLLEALWTCGMFHVLHRLGDRVSMANLTLLTDWSSPILTTQTEVLRTTQYHAFALYANHFGDTLVPVELEAPRLTPDLPVLDVSAAVSDGGRELHLACINYHPSGAVMVDWQLGGFVPTGVVTVVTLSGPHYAAGNRMGEEETVTTTVVETPFEQALAGAVPPHSAVILRLRRAG